MKKTILILSLFFSIIVHSATITRENFITTQIQQYSFNKVKDGWYHATVKYTNYKTGTNSTYTLNVEVENDRVITIDFGNGGSVHSGYNSEGYIYSGGYLSFDKDFDGNITSAYTNVTVSDSDDMKYFKIFIE